MLGLAREGCPRGVWRLRIALDAVYPDIVAECVRAVEAVAPGRAGVYPATQEPSFRRLELLEALAMSDPATRPWKEAHAPDHPRGLAAANLCRRMPSASCAV